MGGIHQPQTTNIKQIILPEIATKYIPKDLKGKLNTNHYTTNKQQTVQVIGEYVNSISSPSNPAYDQKLGTSRKAIREIDKCWDFKPKI